MARNVKMRKSRSYQIRVIRKLVKRVNKPVTKSAVPSVIHIIKYIHSVDSFATTGSSSS